MHALVGGVDGLVCTQRWLELHGFRLRGQFGILDPSSNQHGQQLSLGDFCDGTLLCDLVAKLQNRPKVSAIASRRVALHARHQVACTIYSIHAYVRTYTI